jgi:hypothetical protein
MSSLPAAAVVAVLFDVEEKLLPLTLNTGAVNIYLN